MASCEKCWAESHGDPVRYHKLILERCCSPEEQAGPDATMCPMCARKTEHQHASVCMAGCR